jgi:hypothetical protein
MKNPLLFLTLVDHSYTDRNDRWIESYSWEAIDNDFIGCVPSNNFIRNDFKDALVVAEPNKQTETNNKDSDMISFDVHAVNPSKLDDWKIVINSFIIRSQRAEDKFPYIHLLWMLNFCNWNSSDLVEVLSSYKDQSIPFIVNRGLSRVSRCLSYTKQKMIQQALSQLKYNYEVYQPSVITDALVCMSPQIEENGIHWDLFKLVDYVLHNSVSQEAVVQDAEKANNNKLLLLKRWLQNENASIDYAFLRSLLSIVSNKIQLAIVKRFFHDIRLGKVSFDSKILAEFIDNPFVDFIRYRYCLESPERPIDLTVPLLCDCIITLYQSNGKTFQTFEGILDFAMLRCDITKPSISFGMENFLPQCHGGAIYNNDFKGFIDYSVVCELDESKFTEENLTNSIRRLLDKCHHHTYVACAYDLDKRPLTEEELKKCLCTRIVKDEKTGEEREERKYNCTREYSYKDKWVVSESDYDCLNQFLIEPLTKEDKGQSIQIIDISQTSTEVLANYIRSLVKQLKQVDNNRFIVHSAEVRKYHLLLEYSKPINSRFIPQTKPIVGIKFDVFGFFKTLCQEQNIDALRPVSDEIKEKFQKRESEEIRKRVVETLKKELGVVDFNGSYFEVPYEKELHHRILSLYYFKGTIPNSLADYQIEFLKKQHIGTYTFFCAPKFADEANRATGLHYFWCRGVECFQNNLCKQTLANCFSWSDYTLYHLIEIIGLPKLKETEAGFEPDNAIIEFIACVNRAMKKFKRLRCRSCGHLMYTDKSSGYNRYNYYSCINPTCSEYNHPVYLSYCFNCKKGLIDSRDSARCPNGWYICPTCLSCCTDEQYERQAQRYILQNRPVPSRISEMLGQGHNDKGLYYCPTCGNQTEMVSDGHGGSFRGCATCQINYDEKYKNEIMNDIVGIPL